MLLARVPTCFLSKLRGCLVSDRAGRQFSRSCGKKSQQDGDDGERQREEELQGMLKSRGFFFQSFGIYGGFSHGLDYGPLGALMRQNVRNQWYQQFVINRTDCLPLDTPILSPEPVWKAAGHLAHFTDPTVQCTSCLHVFRADHIVPEHAKLANEDEELKTEERLQRLLAEHNIACSNCGQRLPAAVRATNLMFSTNVGAHEHSQVRGYLRPETAQGIFINFHNAVRSMRLQLPFGLAQMGRAFRNELTPGNFLFRLREFEQMEIEYFCHPEQSDEYFARWLADTMHFLTDTLGLSPERLRQREHVGDERAHYARATVDVEYRYSFGWKELWGVANRTDFDLRQHGAASGEELRYRDPHSNELYYPHVIEPSVGLDRLIYALLSDAYQHDWQGTGRAVLALSPKLTPYLFAVMPVVAVDQRLVQRADALRRQLAAASPGRAIATDSSGSIGRRYRRQDQIGTPFCAVVDNRTLDDDTFTIRFRDSMQQVRLPAEPHAIADFLRQHVPA